MAWPDIIRDIEWDASAGPCEDCENLQDQVDNASHQLSDANKALDCEQDRAAYYKSELKKYQKLQSDTKEVTMSQPKAAPAPPVASSLRMMLDSPIKENPNERTILGTMERINMGEPPLLQAGSQFMRANPPQTVMGHLPRPLGRARPVWGDWYGVCNMQSLPFLDLLKEARCTAHSELTPSMRAALRRVQLQT